MTNQQLNFLLFEYSLPLFISMAVTRHNSECLTVRKPSQEL